MNAKPIIAAIFASAVTNRFWFDALFRSWAAHVARELRTRSP